MQITGFPDRQKNQQVVNDHRKQETVVKTKAKLLLMIFGPKGLRRPHRHWQLQGTGGLHPNVELHCLPGISFKRVDEVAVLDQTLYKRQRPAPLPGVCQLTVTHRIKSEVINQGVLRLNQPMHIACVLVLQRHMKPIHRTGKAEIGARTGAGHKTLRHLSHLLQRQIASRVFKVLHLTANQGAHNLAVQCHDRHPLGRLAGMRATEHARQERQQPQTDAAPQRRYALEPHFSLPSPVENQTRMHHQIQHRKALIDAPNWTSGHHMS